MANKSSAKKAIRTIGRRTAANVRRRSRIRTYIKKVEQAIESGNREAAMKAFQEAQPEIMRGATKGISHRNTASRKTSRLAKRLNGMSR